MSSTAESCSASDSESVSDSGMGSPVPNKRPYPGFMPSANSGSHVKGGSYVPSAKRPHVEPPAQNFNTSVASSGRLSDSDSEDDRRPAFGLGMGSKSSSLAGHSVGAESWKVMSGVSKAKPEDFIVETSVNKAQTSYNKFATKMMAKMGHVAGTGLGKHGQGRVEIVEESKQRGSRGLGFKMKGFEPADVQWKFENEHVSAEEEVVWMPACKSSLPALDMLKSWLREGPEKLSIQDETKFVDEVTLKNVLGCKSVFDELESREMRNARTRSNPYETIRGVFFQNRAAMKMANMDAVFNFMFTEPKTPDGIPVVGSNDLLYFADVCAGPGGFSEYVLWRKKWDAKGFGFTLKGDCDFKLHEFHAASSELFEPFYGVGGKEGDGDIYRPDNQRELRQFVMANTDGKGIHFIMADGGFSVEGQENLQEILSKRLYLCQFIAALMLLREGGHFVCKLFDVFTEFSVGLIYLMYHAFEQVCIFKPVTSRPANSERYIVCKWLRADTAPIILDYMYHINETLDVHHKAKDGVDVTSVVPLDVIKSDPEFFNYIYSSNQVLGRQQSIALSKIQTFAKNPSLMEMRQADIRKQCLELWKVPDEVRTAPIKSETADTKFKKLFSGEEMGYLSTACEHLTQESLSRHIKTSVYDYRCMVSCASERCFILSLGRSHVYKWNGEPGQKWRKADDIQLDIPAETLLEVEFVYELKGEGTGQRKQRGMHVLDGLIVGGVNITKMPLKIRLEKLKKFVKAITRQTRPDLAPIRVKEMYKLENIQELFQPDKLQMKSVKGRGQIKHLVYCTPWGVDLIPTGLYFIRIYQDPWMSSWSKSNQRIFLFNTRNGEKVFTVPWDAVDSHKSCLQSRLFWSWVPGVKIHDGQVEKPSLLSRNQLLEFVHKKKNS